ncbi:hypothetical protein R1flu_025491 [Riccia fluitans]|uniref:EamA domain-containing protein n=1 Tax=Riccia fluitans TaxID=41844 RepID=A0ABD1XYB7_9MARC
MKDLSTEPEKNQGFCRFIIRIVNCQSQTTLIEQNLQEKRSSGGVGSNCKLILKPSSFEFSVHLQLPRRFDGQIEGADDSEQEIEKGKSSQPWFVLPIVVCATIAISAAGALTKLQKNAAPISQAGWRLQLTSLVLLPGFIWQCYRLNNEERERCLRWKNVGVIIVSSISLAFHFGLWIWSLLHTSLPHSLLLVSMPPVIVAALHYLQGNYLSRGETIGVTLGVGGAILMAAGSRIEKDIEVTMLGDLAAFLGAVAFVAYISAGKHLRGWMPLYVYAFPVTAGAAVCLSLAAISMEGMHHSSSGEISGPFGWLRKEYLLLNLALALGPGFVGHTGFNAVLRYCSALLVAMATTLEPLLGSAIGWALNVSGVPGLWTWLGGMVMLAGTLWVSYASEQQIKVKLEEVNRDQNDLFQVSDGLVCKRESLEEEARERRRNLLRASES